MAEAIVTGASSGIGKAIAEMLVKQGYEVYGIGRNFDDEITDPRFHKIVLDLLETGKLLQMLKSLPLQDLEILVNNAGCAYYGMAETIHNEEISEMVRLNTEVPILLSSRLLPFIRKNHGTIINIASISGMHEATHGACYGATKAALIAFSRSLFAENRKHGVRVTCIIPDMTDTDLYRNADFQADTSEGCCLYPDDIAEVVKEVITHSSFVTSEIVVQSQFHRIQKKKQ